MIGPATKSSLVFLAGYMVGLSDPQYSNSINTILFSTIPFFVGAAEGNNKGLEELTELENNNLSDSCSHEFYKTLKQIVVADENLRYEDIPDANKFELSKDVSKKYDKLLNKLNDENLDNKTKRLIKFHSLSDENKDQYSKEILNRRATQGLMKNTMIWGLGFACGYMMSK